MLFSYRKLILIAIVFCSCARKHTPVTFENYAHIFNFTPKESNYKTDKGVSVTLNNPERYNDEVAIEITVKNNTQTIIKLDPADWQYLAHSSTSNGPKLDYFVNPAFRIREIQEDVNARKGYWWKRSLGSIAMVSAGIATNAALENYDEDAGMGTVNDGVNNLTNIPDDAKELKEANQKLSYWEAVLFMPCELQPGSMRNGLVFFKITPDADYYELFITLQDETVTHQLKQTKIE